MIEMKSAPDGILKLCDRYLNDEIRPAIVDDINLMEQAIGFPPGHLLDLDRCRLFNEYSKADKLRDAYYLWCFKQDITDQCIYLQNFYYDTVTKSDIKYYTDAEFQKWQNSNANYVYSSLNSNSECVLAELILDSYIYDINLMDQVIEQKYDDEIDESLFTTRICIKSNWKRRIYIIYDHKKLIIDYEAVRRAVRNEDDVTFGLVHGPDLNQIINDAMDLQHDYIQSFHMKYPPKINGSNFLKYEKNGCGDGKSLIELKLELIHKQQQQHKMKMNTKQVVFFLAMHSAVFEAILYGNMAGSKPNSCIKITCLVSEFIYNDTINGRLINVNNSFNDNCDAIEFTIFDI